MDDVSAGPLGPPPRLLLQLSPLSSSISLSGRGTTDAARGRRSACSIWWASTTIGRLSMVFPQAEHVHNRAALGMPVDGFASWRILGRLPDQLGFTGRSALTSPDAA